MYCVSALANFPLYSRKKKALFPKAKLLGMYLNIIDFIWFKRKIFVIITAKNTIRGKSVVKPLI